MSRRRGGFRIVDGLVGIALAAFGLAWARAYWGDTVASMPGWNWGYDPSRRFGLSPAYVSMRSTMLVIAYVGTTFAIPLGVGLVVVRCIRRPKVPFWRARRPGALACLVASAVSLAVLVTQAVRPSQDLVRVMVGPHGEFRVASTRPFHDLDGFGNVKDPFLNTALQVPRLAGFVVAGAWISLALADRWRPERSWGDRLGRVVGLFWIAAALHFLLFPI